MIAAAMLTPLAALLLGSTPRQAIAALAILAAIRAAANAAPLAVHLAYSLARSRRRP